MRWSERFQGCSIWSQIQKAALQHAYWSATEGSSVTVLEVSSDLSPIGSSTVTAFCMCLLAITSVRHYEARLPIHILHLLRAPVRWFLSFRCFGTIRTLCLDESNGMQALPAAGLEKTTSSSLQLQNCTRGYCLPWLSCTIEVKFGYEKVDTL